MLSLEQPALESGLAAAICGRQTGFLQAYERGRALAPGVPGGVASAGAERDVPEALLRRALQCLAGAPEYSLARRLVEQGRLQAAPDPLGEVARQALAQAGLATWDPGTGELRATALVVALMPFFEAGVEGALHQASP